MKAVFTIVAQNYYAQASTLYESIQKTNPGLDVYVFIAGKADKLDVNQSGARIVEISSLGIADLTDMAFKYDVTEFCTSVKPHCFIHLFETLGYEEVIYFDPDIFVYHDLAVIYRMLDSADIVVTPHILFPELEYTGSVPEGLLLFVGIFNLGFVAMKRSAVSASALQWWKVRLERLCFADKVDGLHVDQKWIDFLPVFCGSRLMISTHLGMNVSFWNLHERELKKEGGRFLVQRRNGSGETDPLVFYHFAKFDPLNAKIIHKDYKKVERATYSEYDDILAEYGKALLAHGHQEFVKIPYTYNFFDNGTPIVKFHRRLYRRLTETGVRFPDPFASGEGSFYRELDGNRLIDRSGARIDAASERDFAGFDKKIRILNRFFIALRTIIGAKNYFLLMKLFLRYCRPENQTFLIARYRDAYVFKNENQ
ncbi:MAG TPA: hypothetical protein VK470_19185 [Bacteroidota bacterium]|nr:hypothetical protein [Bacteroidota bacterium]